MQATDHASSINFLQNQLQEVVTILEKQHLEQSLLERGPSTSYELIESVLHKQHQNRLLEKFSDLHPADIAFILESLPLDQRKVVWDAIKSSQDGQVLLEVSDAVRQTLISGMETEDLASVAGKLHSDEIADIAADLPKRAMLKILRSLNSEDRRHLNTAMS